MSDSVWPNRWQPTRFPRPWDSPGKNTGVGCHFLLQCMKVKSEKEVIQLCLTLHKAHGLQPSRLLHLWDFPGESIGVGCHCLLQMLSRWVITFLPRSKRRLISLLQSPSSVILELYLPWRHGTRCHDLSFKSTFSLSSFTFIKRFFNSLLSAIRVFSSAYLRLSKLSHGEGNGNPLQYSCLENPMDRGAW